MKLIIISLFVVTLIATLNILKSVINDFRKEKKRKEQYQDYLILHRNER